MKVAINKKNVAALKPQAKAYEVVDDVLPGFVLRVESGGTMTYFARFRLPTGERGRHKVGSAATLSPAQARGEVRKVLADALRGIDPRTAKKEARGLTLRQFILEKYQPYAAHQKSGKATVARLLSAFDELLSKKLRHISAWHVEKWRQRRKADGKSAVTINRDMAALRSALARAVEWGELSRHPLEGMKDLDRPDNARVRYLSPEEHTRLMVALDEREEEIRQERDTSNAWRRDRDLKLLPDLRKSAYADHMKPMVLLTLHTGLRRGELFNLRWRDVDLDRRMLTITAAAAKSGKPRYIPLNDVAIDVLKRWLKQAGHDSLVFKSPKTGGRFDNINAAWAGKAAVKRKKDAPGRRKGTTARKGLLERAGLHDFTWHDLRHDFASRLVMAGVDLNTVRDLMGHADIKMTLRYAHLSPEHRAAAVAKLAQTNVIPVDAVVTQQKG